MSNTDDDYRPQDLKRLQQAELDILRDFITICEKYSIDYFGCAGTALGAVRHGGFIPWDDDVDIGIMRSDYERFLTVYDKEFPGKYSVLHAENDPSFPLMTCHFMRNGTVFRQKNLDMLPCNFGIFLDLIIYDNIADNERKRKRQMLRAWFYGKLLILRLVKRPTIYYYGFAGKLVHFCCAAVHYTLRLFHVTPQYLYRMSKKIAGQYKDEQTKRISFIFETKPYTGLADRNDVFPTVKLPFDGLEVRFPNKTDKYLRDTYGDYMTLPPENRRHNHAPSELKFEDD